MCIRDSDRIARVAESHLGRLRVVQIRMRLGDMLEVVVLGDGLQLHHAHGCGRIVTLVNLLIVGVGEREQEPCTVDETLGLPQSGTPRHIRIAVCPTIADGIEAAEPTDRVRRADKVIQAEHSPTGKKSMFVARDAGKCIQDVYKRQTGAFARFPSPHTPRTPILVNRFARNSFLFLFCAR